MNMPSFFVACCLTLVVLILGAGATGVAEESGNAHTRVASSGTISPVGSTNGVDWDRAPRPEERRALLAYLRKL